MSNESYEPGLIPYRYQRLLEKVGFYVLLAVFVAVVLFPFFWMLSTALRPSSEMYSYPLTFLPETFTLENYAKVFFNSNYLTYYLNSIIISAAVITLTTVMATLAGYGLSRIQFGYKRLFARGVLLGYMFPAILLSIPMFILWQQLGIINTYLGVILAETAFSMPFSIWLMWKFFEAVPISLEESAQMTGANRIRAFYDITLPMAKPGMVAIAVFAYAVSWNSYTIPKVLMISSNKWPLTVGIETFIEQNAIQWPLIMAASSLVVLPGFLLVFFLQNSFLRGFRAGGMG